MEFDFSKNTEVKDIGAVPEQFQGMYAKKDDGGYALRSDDPGVKGAVEAIVGLNTALKASRGENKALRGKAVDLSDLSDYGTTVDEIKKGISTKIQELQDQLAQGGKAKLDLEKVKADLAAAHAKDIEAKDARSNALLGQLKTILVDNQIRAALGDQAVDPDLVIPFVQKQVETIEEDGKFKVLVVDKDNTRRYSGVTGNPMTINELVAEMKSAEKFQPLFKSEAPSGAGTAPGSSAGRILQNSGETLTPLQKIARGLSKKR